MHKDYSELFSLANAEFWLSSQIGCTCMHVHQEPSDLVAFQHLSLGQPALAMIFN